MKNQTTLVESVPINNSPKTSALTVWLLLILLAAIWGTSFILMKKSLVVYSSLQVGSIRILSAFLFFIPILIAKRKQIPNDKWLYFGLTGLLGVFFPAFIFTIAGKHLPSALSGALNSLTPLCTLIVGALFFTQKIKALQIWGILIGLIGSSLLIFSNISQPLTFNAFGLLILVATVMYGFNLNIVKKNLNEVPALIVTTGLLTVIGPLAAILLFSTDFWQISSQSESFWPLFYAVCLGVISTGLATVLFNHILQISSPVLASSVTYLIPIFAFMWGILDSETLLIQHFLGMAIILVGVFLVNKK
ncbi:MAG: DMT family transporter [Bacteroidota bacterium]